MQYALGADTATAPTEGWGASVPTATDAGTYFVWYQVVGDDNHDDMDAACVTATIAKAGLDELAVSIGSWVVGAEDKSPSVTGNAGEGKVVFAYKVQGADDSTYAETVPTAAGKYTVRATVEETRNYNGAAAAADFEIEEAIQDTATGQTEYQSSASDSGIKGISDDGGALNAQLAEIAKQDDTATQQGQQKEVDVKLNAASVAPESIPASAPAPPINNTQTPQARPRVSWCRSARKRPKSRPQRPPSTMAAALIRVPNPII
jgi:hypothetical protein